MFIILLLFFIGLLVGFLLKRKRKLQPFIEKSTEITLYILILILGISIGANKEILGNLQSIGLSAAAVSVGTILGSMLLTQALNKTGLIREK